jgi:hypothetical protein
MKRFWVLATVMSVAAWQPERVGADVFELVTGVAPGTSPGAPRSVNPSSFPTGGVPGSFRDGQRLGGTPSAAATAFGGVGTPFFNPNQFGSLSFMYRRGSVPIPAGPGVTLQAPVMAIDYLGGPQLDLDGDLNNGSRSLTPVPGQTPVVNPAQRSFVELNFSGSAVSLDGFDATGNNEGFQGIDASFATTVNTIAGTQPDGSGTGPINPGVDTRTGTLTPTGIAGVTAISDLGFEFWQDSISPASSTAGDLGTLQYLGKLRGYRVEADVNGNFPTLAGQGLGSTLWPQVDASQVGQTFNTASGVSPFATIDAGPAGDDFTFGGNGGLPLTDFGGDLGAYLDQVVVPALDGDARSFVFLEGAGFGINNSFDPVFGDTVGYDMVLVGQFIPEPHTIALLALGMLAVARRRK